MLIAHRLSTAMRADRIVVVGDGRLLEVGSHAELVALGGHYAEMYEPGSTSRTQRRRLGRPGLTESLRSGYGEAA